MDWLEKNMLWLFAVIVSAAAAVLRINGLDMVSMDYRDCLGPWFETIRANGGLAGISQQVGDYNVLYQIIIAMMTYLPFNPLYMYKALSIVFDYLLALCAGAIVLELSGRDRFRALLAYAAVLMMPTVFIDSAWWAQCDSIYATFILLALLALLRRREMMAFLFISIAFQFKQQTIFVVPFLLYAYVRTRRFSLLHFLLIPLLSVALSVLSGRSPLATFEIYAGQTLSYANMTYGFPSVWNLISNHGRMFRFAALMLTALMLGVGLLTVMYRKVVFDRQNAANWLIWTVWTCLMFLPSMHERYAYVLGILLAMAAVLNAKMLGYVVLYEMVILVGYSGFLWEDTALAQIPGYVPAALFLAGYVAFTYQALIRGERLLEMKE